MQRYLLLLALVCCGNISIAQSDSVMITELNTFQEGLYLTHQDFRKNNSIPKETIFTKIDKDQIDIYSKLTSEEKIVYTIANTTYTTETKNVWGFMQNRTLFINYNGSFYRVPVFGAICYFAGIVEVTGYYNGIYDPMFGSSGGRAVKTKELTEFILSYYNGKVTGFDVDYLDELLRNDEDVYKLFKSASKRKRSKEATRFVRMYNEKHQIYYYK